MDSCYLHDFTLLILKPDLLVEACTLSHCEFIPVLFFFYTVKGNSHIKMKSGDLYFLRAEFPHKLFEILLQSQCLFLNLFTFLTYIYVLTHRCVFHILSYNLDYFLCFFAQVIFALSIAVFYS